MCGIYGSETLELTEEIGRHLEHRGTKKKETRGMGHILHSVVGDVEQPLKGKGMLVANCEIYNWKTLSEERDLTAENDAELLFQLLEIEGLNALESLDGIYAFAYCDEDELILARDLLGVNPIWYSTETFSFSSEKQALEKAGLKARELHPRQILRYDRKTKEISFEQREFFEINEKDASVEENAERIKELFLKAVEKRVPSTELGLLFSGGVDSTLIAAALQELEKDFTCYTSGIQYGNTSKPRDLEWAEKTAEEMNLDLEIREVALEEVEEALPKLANWISSTSAVKLGVALPFHMALNGDEKVVMSGLGSEQLYAGYHRQQNYLNKECLSGLRGLFERDLYRDNVIGFRNGYELRVPFLDCDLVENALTIPSEQKQSEGYRKYVLRKAAVKLGVPEDVAWRGKVAAQYGSNFDKAISKLAKENEFVSKQAYLNSLRNGEYQGGSKRQNSDVQKSNNRLVALTSGGKDSNAAIYRIMRRKNEISCLLSLRSENRDSYMFDSKKEEKIIEEQASKMRVPLIFQETMGEKEEELNDLEKGLEKAVEDYEVEGVVSGALASTYQRDRVEKVAESLGLKVFTPLWSENPVNYMRWLVRKGFEVEITDVAARGLEKEWEGRVLDQDNVEELIELSEKYGFHAAGEGGEYETQVIDFPGSMLR